MDRRTFLETAGKGSLGLVLSSRLSAEGNPSGAAGGKTLTAKEVHAHLRTLCEVAEPSVDRIVIGRPLVVINHGTSEEYGMRLLDAHLKEAFPDKNVIHLEQGCGYQWITA